jgi:hypothetical protein
MAKYIAKWISDGLLELGKNYLTDSKGCPLISVEFLKGVPLAKESKLKRAA